MTPYDLLFGDAPLDTLLLATSFPPGSKLDAARSRMWEGRWLDTADAASGAGEPWATFITALARMNTGQSAQRALRSIAEDPSRESRARLFAWTALRKAGDKPPPAHAQEVLACVVEVPVDGGFDVLAAYADGSTRFLGHTGRVIAREGDGTPTPLVASVLAEAYPLLAVAPAARPPQVVPPEPTHVRLAALSANGMHQVKVPWAAVEAGGPYFKLFHAAALLLEQVTKV